MNDNIHLGLLLAKLRNQHLDNDPHGIEMAAIAALEMLVTCLKRCQDTMQAIKPDELLTAEDCDRATQSILTIIGETIANNEAIAKAAARTGGIYTGKNPPIMDAIVNMAENHNLNNEPSMQALIGLVKEISLVFERGRTEIIPQALDANDADYLTAEILEAIGQEISRDACLKEIAASVSLFLPSSLPGAIPGRPDLLTHEFFDAIAAAIQDDRHTETIAAAAGLKLSDDVALKVPASQESDAIAKAYADDGVNWPFGKLSDLILKKANEVYGDRDDPHYPRAKITKLMLTIQGIERAIAKAKETLLRVDNIEGLGGTCNLLSFELAGLIEKLRSHPSNVQPRSLSGIICEVANTEAGDSEDARAEVTRAVKLIQSIEDAISSSKQAISTLSEQTDIKSLGDQVDLVVKHLSDLIGAKPILSHDLAARADALGIDSRSEPVAEVLALIGEIESNLIGRKECYEQLHGADCFMSHAREIIGIVSGHINASDRLTGIAIATGLCPSSVAPAIKSAHHALKSVWDVCYRELWPQVGEGMAALEAIPIDKDKWLAVEDSGKNARDRALEQLGIAPSHWESILAEVRDSDKPKIVTTLSCDLGEKILIALREAREGEISAIAARKRILKDVEVWMRAIQMVIESTIIGDLDDEINARLRGASSVIESSLDKIAKAEKEGIATWWNRPSIFKSDVHYWHYIQKIEDLRSAINDLNPEHPEAKIWKRQVPEYPF